jgi:hypothetical protein
LFRSIVASRSRLISSISVNVDICMHLPSQMSTVRRPIPTSSLSGSASQRGLNAATTSAAAATIASKIGSALRRFCCCISRL